MFISHYHDPDDGFANLEEMDLSAGLEEEATASNSRLDGLKAVQRTKSGPRIERSVGNPSL